MTARWAIAAASAASVALIMVGTFHYGFHTDDYFMLRPHSAAELVRVWRGTWDTGGVWVPYFRPLSQWANEATFALAGYSAPLVSAVVAIELAVLAWLVGLFVLRELQSPVAGGFAAALVVFQPSAANSLVWYFQQNHRWSAAAAMVALLVWQQRRVRPSAIGWWPIHVAVLVGALFKEDVIIVEPLLLLWQWLRARWIGDVPRPSLAMCIAIAGGCAGFTAAHALLLSGVGGEISDQTAISRLPYHLIRDLYVGLIRFRDVHGGHTSPAQWAASATIIVGSVAGVWTMWARRSPRRMMAVQGARFAWAAAGVTALASPWYTRHHLIAIGGVFVLSACVLELRDGATRSARAVAGVLSAAVLLSCWLSTRATMDDYRPCGRSTLGEDASQIEWLTSLRSQEYAWVPQWLELKARLCDAGQYYELDEAIRRGDICTQ